MSVGAMSIVAMGVAGLVLLTAIDAHRRVGGTQDQLSVRSNAAEAPAIEQAPCAIDHARFGGQRAQLVRVLSGDVPSYVVLEIGKRDPTMRQRRAQWLRAAYGEAEHIWLGEYASAEAAMARAARLCPPDVRCLPGEAGCGGRLTPLLTPAQIFFGQ